MRQLSRFYGGKNRKSWLKSYAHATILHEFGHALGLSHEHYHSDCQGELKLESDAGYKATLNEYGEFIPDREDRSPGALLAFSGPPNYWPSWKTLNALDWNEYKENLPVDAAIVSSVLIDRNSVMLYSLEEYLMQGGYESSCAFVPDAVGRRYATELSPNDIKYFTTFYAPQGYAPAEQY